MIEFEKIPRVGVLIATVNFPIPIKPNFANDFRRTAIKFGSSNGLTALNYALHDPPAGRSYAGMYEFGFSRMTPDRFKALASEIRRWKRFKWCESTDIMIADWVETEPTVSKAASEQEGA